MPVLLSPAALWTLAALALPLALHLWRQPPRTVLVGSVRFLQSHAGRRLHDLRWRERLLLAVRLLLLAGLAGLLMGPVWRQRPSSKPQRWILLDPAASLAGTSTERRRMLEASGYSPRLLAPGSPAADAAPPDLWSLLQEADASLPAGSKLAVFSPGRLAALRGVRPALRSDVEWVETPDVAGEAPRAWIESARVGSPPTVTIGASDAAALWFAPTPPEGWRLETIADRVRLLDPRGMEADKMAPSAAPNLAVLILHDAERAEDARYLAAAVRAVAEVGGARLDLRTLSTTSEPTNLPAAGWTFWLSGQPVPDALHTRPVEFFRDNPDGGSPVSGWMVAPPSTVPGDVLLSGVRLWRRGHVPAGSVVWTDEHGSPLLTRTADDHGSYWQFASRFHPAWTDLPISSAFPTFLRSLLLPESAPDFRHDLRRTVASQAHPTKIDAPSLPLADHQNRDLHVPMWALVALLFVLERVLSHRPASSNDAPTREAVAR